MLKEKVEMIWYEIIKILLRLLFMIFFRMRFFGVENVPKKGSFLFLCNHQSCIDPVFATLGTRRHLGFIARDSLFKGVFGPMIKSVGAIPIKRGKADIATMKLVIGKLKQGRGILLYPEATRTLTGKIAAIKPGFGLLSRRGNAVVIPVLLDGAFESWPKGKKMFKPGRIDVVFGTPIQPEEIKKMGDRKFADLVTKTLRQMQAECRINAGKKPFEYQAD